MFRMLPPLLRHTHGVPMVCCGQETQRNVEIVTRGTDAAPFDGVARSLLSREAPVPQNEPQRASAFLVSTRADSSAT